VRQRVEEAHVIEDDDLEAFATAWFTGAPGDAANHPALYAALARAQDRFDALDDGTQEAFRSALSQFVRM
jgi:hypothetical protein